MNKAKEDEKKNEKKESAIGKVRKGVPKSIPELERQPLHLSLIGLAGIVALILSVPSLFISAMGLEKIVAGLAYGLFTLFCDLIFGFLLLYCFILGKRRPKLASGLAFILSILIVPLGGFAGLIAGVLGITGSIIGLFRGNIPPIIDEIFLIYRDGRLIKHYTRRLKPMIDQDILSSMLVAVQEFIKDSFVRSTGEDTALDEMKFGEFKIIICRGKWIIVASLVFGEGAEKLKKEIAKVVLEIERKYESVLKDWDGLLDNMRPLNKEMEKLIVGKYD